MVAATAVDQARVVHLSCDFLHSYLTRDDDRLAAFRSSFNLVVALTIEFAAETDKSARRLARLLRDAAAAELR